MASEESVVIGWLMGAVLALVVVIVFIIQCDNSPRSGYFFVGGSDSGYAVMMDDSGRDSTRITKWMSLDEAKHTCDAFNATLGDKANK